MGRLKSERLELKSGFNFVTVGRLDEGKNHQLLIRAMVEVEGNLYIIGDGTLKEELQELIESLNLEDRVYLVGKDQKPYRLYWLGARIYFLIFHPNRRRGFPNVFRFRGLLGNSGSSQFIRYQDLVGKVGFQRKENI